VQEKGIGKCVLFYLNEKLIVCYGNERQFATVCTVTVEPVAISLVYPYFMQLKLDMM
jgi:hypothetical protein